MKYSIIFTTVIVMALSLYSFTAKAETVTGLTSYASDTILNASDLNNDNTQIKFAVDGNDDNINTNRLNIGINVSDIVELDVRVSQNESDIVALNSGKSVVVFDRTRCETISIFRTCPSDTLTTIVSTVTSVTINAPSPGRVIVSFSGQYNVNHTLATTDMFCIEIETSSSANPFPACGGNPTIIISGIDASHRQVNVGGSLPTEFYRDSIHTQQVFTVTTGTHTYYLRGQSNSIGTTINLRQSNMIAYFIAD